MKITAKEMSLLQRMLGIIDGAVYGSGKRESVIYDAIETISSVLDKAEVVTEGSENNG